MCVIFWIQDHKKYKLVIAANRDEYLDRPTLPAQFWVNAPHVLGGADLAYQQNYHSMIVGSTSDSNGNNNNINLNHKNNITHHHQPIKNIQPIHSFNSSQNGTWMAIARDGRIAFLTNYREHPSNITQNACSRGHLVTNFLAPPRDSQAVSSPKDYADALSHQQTAFNGYNLVVGNMLGQLWYVTNRANRIPLLLDRRIVHGLSNGVLPMPSESETWHKVARGKTLFAQALESAQSDQHAIDNLLSMLSDTSECNTSDLPPNMFDYTLEHALSPICIGPNKIPNGNYGTRTQTVILVDYSDRVVFVEVDRHAPVGDVPRMYSFVIDSDGGGV